MNNFFNRLDRFSFKDSIAAAFIAVFFYACLIREIVLVTALIPPIMLILGCYFGQEVYSSYLDRKNGGVVDEQQSGTAAPYTSTQGTPIS